jgi:hypothetical protein
MNGYLYREVNVWKRVSDREAARYRCFERLPEGGYGIQSVDWYQLPLKEKEVKFLENNFLELMIEKTLANRTKLYPTVTEAIAAFEQNFGNETLKEDDEAEDVQE